MEKLSYWTVFSLVFVCLVIREGLRVRPENDKPVSKALYRFSRWAVRKFRRWLVGREEETSKSDEGAEKEG